MHPHDLFWLVGLLEGEGSFMRGPPSQPHLPVIRLEMTDEDVVCRVSVLVGVQVVRIPARKSRWKDTYAITFRGASAVALMREIRPHMGMRRQHQIDRALACYREPTPPKLNPEDIQTIGAELRAGVSVSALARRYGVARATIRWARNKIHGAVA